MTFQMYKIYIKYKEKCTKRADFVLNCNLIIRQLPDGHSGQNPID